MNEETLEEQQELVGALEEDSELRAEELRSMQTTLDEVARA